MTQLSLFPPPAASDRPLPESVRKQARELVSALLIAVFEARGETQRRREADEDE